MQIVDDKLIVFKTRSPEKYAVIPKHKILERATDGSAAVAVYWGLDESRVLKNLGLKNVPSPITRRYSWPGRFKPMAHQVETASFLTLHKRAFVFSEPGCVDSETEYLSPSGWVKISEYKEGKVAQYYPETGRIEFVDPYEYVKIPCETMVRFKTKYGIDQLLSPEHRVLIRSNANKDKWCVMSAEQVLEAHDDYHAGVVRENQRKKGSKTVSFTHAGIPTVFSYDGAEGVKLSNAALRVQVAVIADGSFYGPSGICTMRLKKERKKRRLRELLIAAGIPWREREQNTNTAQGFMIFSFAAPIRVKTYDARFWKATSEQLRVIGEEVVYWDGAQRGRNKGPQFFSVSKASADFVQFAWNSMGYTARITEDVREDRNTCYVVTRRSGSKGGEHGVLALRSRNSRTVTVEPSTDGFKYCFRVPTTYLLFRRNGCVFASGNTGKTLSALWAADYLMQRKEVRRCLILCPLSIMQSAWLNDLNSSIIHRSAIVAHHAQASRRIEMVQQDYEFVIVNYDGLNLIADEVKNDGRFDLIIVDEANAYKNVSTKRWKALKSLMNPNTHLWMMTGTPASQSPEDAYGLAKLVNPSNVPMFFTAWRDKVMYKATIFKWSPKENAAQIVHEALQPAIRFTKEQCLDLPPVMTLTREVPLTTQQAKYYNMLKEQMMVQTAGETITAVNAAAGVQKLLQISCGAAYTDGGEVVEFDAAPRLAVLREVLEETERKVIVFSLFRNSITTIQNDLTKHGITNEAIHGDVSPSKRADIISRFQNTKDPRVLVMQPAATAHGITLTAADTVVFFGPLMSVEQYIQAIARADRKGQDSDKVTVIHIQGSPLERKMFKALEGKVDDNTLLTEMFTTEIKN